MLRIIQRILTVNEKKKKKSYVNYTKIMRNVLSSFAVSSFSFLQVCNYYNEELSKN